MADIFVSYKREDRERVRPLVAALEGLGWTVWWDTRIDAGEIWDERIEQELDAAQCVLVVWSSASVGARWVRTEANEGLSRQCLVPVAIDDVLPPLAFRLIETSNLTAWKGDTANESFRRMCGGIARLVAGSGAGGTLAGEAAPAGESADTLYQLAIDAQDAAQAIGYYSRAIDIDPSFGAAYMGRAAHYAEAQEYALAVQDYTVVIDLDPEDPWAYWFRGDVHFRAGDFTRAIADFDRAIGIDPNDAGWYEARADAYERRNGPGDRARATADYQQALAINPNSRLANDSLKRLAARR